MLILLLFQASLRISAPALDIVWLNGRYWTLEDAPGSFVFFLNPIPLQNNRKGISIFPDPAVKLLACTMSAGCMYVSFLDTLLAIQLDVVFQVQGLLRAVPSGRYKVRWRLAFDGSSYGLENTRFIATVNGFTLALMPKRVQH
jgi:hypothetical protein